MSQLSNQPPRGTYDWFPEEFTIRKYIFDTWRRVCTSFGYEEYLTPLVEYADVYRAKSGEDVGGKELTIFKDRADRELAIRPEMTPSITRMISKKYGSMQKPVRYFSIANFFRNEKPQRGRNREFWQLNYDIFGDNTLNADIEILQIAIEIMLALGAPANSFKVYINNRRLINDILDKLLGTTDYELRTKVIRLLDKMQKISKDELDKNLLDLGVSEENISKLYNIFASENEELFIKEFPEIENSEPYKESRQLMSFLKSLGYGEYVEFKPSLMRGFDYYDGMVFEVFDTSPNNSRSMFGGGRYNGLANIFGVSDLPAVGAAPGDETLRLFLESWNLLDRIKELTSKEVYYLPVLDSNLATKTLRLAKELRNEGKTVVQNSSQQSLGKSLDWANKKGIKYVVIFGEYENNDGVYKIKNMETGEEQTILMIGLNAKD